MMASRPKKQTDTALPERLPYWGVLMLESYHSDQFQMKPRTHDFLKVVFVLEGSGVINVRSESLEFGEGEVFVVPAGYRNQIVDDQASAASLYICCISKRLLQFDQRLIKSIRPQVLRGQGASTGGQLTSRIAAALRRMLYTQERNTPTCSVEMVAEAASVLSWILKSQEQPKRSTRKKRSRVDSETVLVRDYIQSLPNEFFEQTTIDDAAKSIGLSRRQFTRLFQEIAGESWLERVRSLAIKHAEELLSESQKPIVSVAFECGFNDLSTFYRQFQKRTGKSPAKFRALHQS